MAVLALIVNHQNNIEIAKRLVKTVNTYPTKSCTFIEINIFKSYFCYYFGCLYG